MLFLFVDVVAHEFQLWLAGSVAFYSNHIVYETERTVRIDEDK